MFLLKGKAFWLFKVLLHPTGRPLGTHDRFKYLIGTKYEMLLCYSDQDNLWSGYYGNTLRKTILHFVRGDLSRWTADSKITEFQLNKLKHVLMGNAFQAKYGIRKVLSEMLLKLNNDQ